MMLQVPNVLTSAQLGQFREALQQADWADGKITAGYQSAKAKHNLQLPEDHPTTRQLGGVVLDALAQNTLFMSAALPLKVFPPLFNCYQVGGNFGVHVDNAIRDIRGTPHRVRTDISATLFLSEPGEYDGGELVIEDTFGAHKVKLPAGHMVLYPASSLHKVEAVTRGARIASFFWIQSLVREDAHRAQLFDLDNAIQALTQSMPEHPALVQLTGVYHNLLRGWSQT
jgi:PKHD-type hydroxylase